MFNLAFCLLSIIFFTPLDSAANSKKRVRPSDPDHRKSLKVEIPDDTAKEIPDEEPILFPPSYRISEHGSCILTVGYANHYSTIIVTTEQGVDIGSYLYNDDTQYPINPKDKELLEKLFIEISTKTLSPTKPN